MNVRYRYSSAVVMATLLVAFLVVTGQASTFQNGKDVRISPLHRIDDDFYSTGENLTIEGEITGDLLSGCAQARIKGLVGGSVNLGTRYTDHDGRVLGAFRWIGERLTVNGQIEGSLIALGGQVITNQGSVIGRDATIRAAQVSHSGVIIGNADISAKSIDMNGRIEGNAKFESKSITISPPAIITGTLTYITAKEDDLTVEPGAVISGELLWQAPEADADDTNVLSNVAFRLASLLAAFIFGAIMFVLVRPYVEEAYFQLRNRFAASLAAGLLVLLGLVLAIIILTLALVGTAVGTLFLSGDLAILGLFVLVLSILMVPISSFATVSGAILLYSGVIVVALLIGYMILGRRDIRMAGRSKLALMIGLVILTLATALPYVALVIMALTAIIGAGAIILGINNCRRGVHSSEASVKPIDINE